MELVHDEWMKKRMLSCALRGVYLILGAYFKTWLNGSDENEGKLAITEYKTLNQFAF